MVYLDPNEIDFSTFLPEMRNQNQKVTSKPYGGNFYALAKNYVKTFGILDMTAEQKRFFMAMSQDEADRFVERMYDVHDVD